MNIGHVYIKGQIGNTYNETGEIIEKGVMLLDIIEQTEALEEVDQIHFHINSPGGYVEIGNSIADFISSLGDKSVTIAEDMCASIATKIHLAAPLQNRYIQSNCKYIIHNPFLAGVTGDADQLATMAEDVKKIEMELEKMYAKATGMDKDALSGLMKVETALTAEQCLNFNFASKIVPAEQMKAVALIYTEKNSNTMSTSLKNRLKAAVNMAKGTTNDLAVAIANREVKAAIIETDNGTIETPFVDIMVGDAVTVDGVAAADGTYKVASGEVEIFMEGMAGEGTIIEVAEGAITSISAEGADGGDGGDDPSVEDLVAEIAALKETNATLTTEKAEAEALATKAVEEVEAIAKLGSTFKTPAAQAQFGKGKTSPKNEGITRESMADRKASYKK